MFVPIELEPKEKTKSKPLTKEELIDLMKKKGFTFTQQEASEEVNV